MSDLNKIPRSADIQMKISASSPIIWLRQIFRIFSLHRIFPYRCLYAFQHDNARDILSHWPPKYHSERILCTTEEFSGIFMTLFLENQCKFQDVYNKLERTFEKNSFVGTISESQKIYDDDFFELLKL